MLNSTRTAKNLLPGVFVVLAACATSPSGGAAKPQSEPPPRPATNACPDAGAEGCAEGHFTAQKMKARLFRQQRDEQLEEGRKAFIERQN